MFGIGMWELVVIVLILVIAVGPKRMPGFIKAVGKAYREFRKATRELRASTGIDDLLQDESLKELNELRRPVQLFDPSPPSLSDPKDLGKHLAPSKRKPVQLKGPPKKTIGFDGLSEYELQMELPPQGLDFAELQYRAKIAVAQTAAEAETEPEDETESLPQTRAAEAEAEAEAEGPADE